MTPAHFPRTWARFGRNRHTSDEERAKNASGLISEAG